MTDPHWQQALFTQAAPELGNQYRDDPLLAGWLRRIMPAGLLQSLERAASLRYLHRPANLEDVFLKLTGREMRDEA